MNTVAKGLFPTCIIAIAAIFCTSGARADTFVETYENPGVQNSTVTFSGGVSIETFDSASTGTGQTFTTNFGPGLTQLTYSGVEILGADQYGGAGGNGQYAVTFDSTGYSITLSQSATYFGYWLSALDSGNVVEFYSAGALVGSLDPTGVLGAIGSNSAYFGNPNAAFAGQNGNQPYAFINFFDTTGSFDQVVFLESPRNGGYESDNHTIGNFSVISGNPVTPVPEPSSWALMALGLVGVARFASRRKSVDVQASDR